ncbi:PAS domain-containing sensor histidine kinase [Novosphingobium sp.]|uniref:sensor histidine kinase n=1 Tax=Novosphingobium sp. TaxID=1874826 RepID=UPI003BAD62E5
MMAIHSKDPRQVEALIERFRASIGPFVAAAEATHMPMIFADGQAADHPIAFANQAFRDLTGFGEDALLGERISVLLGEVMDTGTSAAIQAAIAEGASGNWELQCRRADRSEFLAAIFLSPMRDAQQVIRQNLLAFIELGRPVDRLLEQRNELHALYEQAPGFIATSEGPEHRFTFANASYKRFVGRENLVGRKVAEAMPEVVEQGFLGLLDQVYRTGEPFVGRGMPIEIVDDETGNTDQRYADFVYQAVRNAGGTITGLFCEGYDVTVQRKTAESLSALQSEMIHVSRVNAMGTMATTLAHELNQPLSAITNYAAGGLKLIDPGAQETERLTQALEAIGEAAQRAADIIRNVRELTRRRETKRMDFDLQAAVGECVRLVRATVSPGIRITDHIAAGTTMAADRVQIQQVIINLLRNACEAVIPMDRQEVSVSAHVKHGSLVVCVIDSGPGVTAEAAQDIFSWSDSTKEGGMGFGLSICRTIIETHRGRIWLENSGPDGSEFCFSVPLPAEALAA